MYIRQRDVVVGTALVLYIVFFALSPPAAVRTVLSNPVGVAASFGLAIYITLYYSRPIGALLIVALLASMTRTTEGFDTYTGTFNEQTYLAANPDVKAAVDAGRIRSGRAHWDQFGMRENRQGSGLTKVASSRTYQTLANTDYVRQGDIRVVTGDVATCRAQCDSTPNCKGFVQSGTRCFLKDANVRTPSYVQGLTYHYTGAAPSAAATAPAVTTPTTTATTTPPITTPTAPAPSTPAVAPPPPAARPPAPAAPPARPVMACNIENFAPF